MRQPEYVQTSRLGPWEDPRNPHPGSGGAVPDVFWAQDDGELGDAVRDATNHAMLDDVPVVDGPAEAVWDRTWISVRPEHDDRRVTLTSQLFDLDPLSTEEGGAPAEPNPGVVRDSPTTSMRISSSGSRPSDAF